MILENVQAGKSYFYLIEKGADFSLEVAVRFIMKRAFSRYQNSVL